MSDFGEWLGAETCQLCGKGPGHNEGCAMTKQPDTDAIDELVAELEDEAQQLSGSSFRNGCPDCGISSNLASKSADTIADLRNQVAVMREALLDIRNIHDSDQDDEKKVGQILRVLVRVPVMEALSATHSRDDA